MVELAAPARNGDSGGPILNSRGELAGVLFGSAFGRTTGSYCGRAALVSRLGRRRLPRISSQAMMAQHSSSRNPVPVAAIPAAMPVAVPVAAPVAAQPVTPPAPAASQVAAAREVSPR